MDTAVERSVDLDAPVDDVWTAITEDDAISDWFGGEVHLDPVPGGGGWFDVGGGEVRRARVDEVDPGRRLVWRWWNDGDDEGPITAVTFELTPVGAGTRLVVTERPILLGARPSASLAVDRVMRMRACARALARV